MNDSNFPTASAEQPLTRTLALPLQKSLYTMPMLGLIVACWLYLEFVAGGSTNSETLVQYGANYGPAVLQGETWRFFTSMFIHIGLMHLIFNSYALLVFGQEMERVYGPNRFLTIYLLSGLYGSLASFASRGPYVLSAGASGAIFGVIGMNLAFFWLHRDKLGQFGKQQLTNTLVIIGINVAYGFANSGIDNMAHLGGLVSGLLLGMALAPRYQTVGDMFETHLEDTVTLQNRWWVVAFAVCFLWAGTRLALLYWRDMYFLQ